MFTFGTGTVVLTPKTDFSGAAIATPSPVQIGILQDIDIDIDFEVKELYGAFQFPVDVGRGKGKITMKAKAADINGALANVFLFGQTLTSGYEAIYAPTSGFAIPGTGATGGDYAVTVSPVVAGVTGVYAGDLGVRDGNGVPYTRLTGAPTGAQIGSYYPTGPSGADGYYLFSKDDHDAGVTPFITTLMTNSSLPAKAKKSTVSNAIMGYAPTFEVNLMEAKNGKTLWLRFPNVQSTKLSLPNKNDDYSIHDMDMSAFADSSGNIMYYSLSE